MAENAEKKAEAKDLLRDAYGVAMAELRERYRDEFMALYEKEVKARGLEWKPRLTKQQKAEQQIRQLLAEHPELAAKFSAPQHIDNDNVE